MQTKSTHKKLITFLSLFVFGLSVNAQLTDITQTEPSVPGSHIGKSLEQQVGEGRGDILTPDSSLYIIKRDPARSIRRGRQLFQRKFTEEQGLGPRVNSTSTGNISTHPALGAGLSDSCASCHARPRGAAGFGGAVATKPDSRDAPHLFGLGLQEMLADEITQQLRLIRQQAIEEADSQDRTITKRLRARGVYYGSISVSPEGTVDTSRVQGIDEDLRIRPFFAEGKTISIREFVVGAFNDEMGLQAYDPDLTSVADGNRVVTPSGMVLDPAEDTFNTAPVSDAQEDADGDGVSNELDPALIDHMEFYLLNYFKPGTGKQTYQTRIGYHTMRSTGCFKCHVPNFRIETDRRVADVETRHDRRKGIFNTLYATAETRFDVVDDGQDYPQIVPQGESFVVRNIFTDFKRHDLGEAFHERNYDGTVTKEFMTEPLWGVGSTAPYGHDGRSINLEEVILRHGGEAKRSRDKFARLSSRRKGAVLAFLESLVLFPPDDTASNLNPGDKSGYIQDPENHGSINLGALFQIPDPNDLGE